LTHSAGICWPVSEAFDRLAAFIAGIAPTLPQFARASFRPAGSNGRRGSDVV